MRIELTTSCLLGKRSGHWAMRLDDKNVNYGHFLTGHQFVFKIKWDSEFSLEIPLEHFQIILMKNLSMHRQVKRKLNVFSFKTQEIVKQKYLVQYGKNKKNGTSARIELTTSCLLVKRSGHWAMRSHDMSINHGHPWAGQKLIFIIN